MSYFATLFGLLAIAAVGLALRRRFAVVGQGLVVAGCLGCLGVMTWEFYRSFFGSAEDPPDRYHAVVGYFMGHQVARELGRGEGTVLVIIPHKRSAERDAAESMVDTFTRVLRANPRIDVETVEVAGASRGRGNGPLASEFGNALSGRSDAVACVSFMGTPAGIEQMPFLREREQVPLVCLYDSSGKSNWLPALEQGVVRRVIVPRPGAKPSRSEQIAGSPDEIFHRFYLMITPETAGQTARELGSD